MKKTLIGRTLRDATYLEEEKVHEIDIENYSERTTRLKVDGGYIYKFYEVFADGQKLISTCFVAK